MQDWRILTLSLFFIGMISCMCRAQNDAHFDLQPSFLAIIVPDIDKSSSWYIQNLGFSEINRNEMEERGIRQLNMQKGDTFLELIQLSNTKSADDLLAAEPTGTRLSGFFKFGFTISEFDRLVDYLKEREVEFQGDVVRDPQTNKRMLVIRDPDGNRIQLFEN